MVAVAGPFQRPFRFVPPPIGALSAAEREHAHMTNTLSPRQAAITLSANILSLALFASLLIVHAATRVIGCSRR